MQTLALAVTVFLKCADKVEQIAPVNPVSIAASTFF
jgi:hypothetical protein